MGTAKWKNCAKGQQARLIRARNSSGTLRTFFPISRFLFYSQRGQATLFIKTPYEEVHLVVDMELAPSFADFDIFRLYFPMPSKDKNIYLSINRRITRKKFGLKLSRLNISFDSENKTFWAFKLKRLFNFLWNLSVIGVFEIICFIVFVSTSDKTVLAKLLFRGLTLTQILECSNAIQSIKNIFIPW